MSDFLAHPGAFLFQNLMIVAAVVVVYRLWIVLDAAYHWAKRYKKSLKEQKATDSGGHSP